MNTPSSLDEYKAEIARYLDAFARSLPAQINGVLPVSMRNVT